MDNVLYGAWQYIVSAQEAMCQVMRFISFYLYKSFGLISFITFFYTDYSLIPHPTWQRERVKTGEVLSLFALV